jgi:hypothetical protein
MARGWESKAVEAQIEESTYKPSTYQDSNISPQERQVFIKKQDLLLSRKRIVQQIDESSSERYSDLLRRTLADLDAQISDFD